MNLGKRDLWSYDKNDHIMGKNILEENRAG